MRSEWQPIRISELGTVITGRTPPSKIADAFDGGQTPFVTPSDMDARKQIDETLRSLSETGLAAVQRAAIPKGSIMVSCIGSDMGKAAVAGRDCVTNQQINSIAVTGDIDRDFIYYNLLGRKAELQHLASGAAQPILNKSRFSEIEILLPPIAEQRQISKVLAALDNKIDNNRALAADLEAMARTIFKSWFVDFDPVKAKMEGRAPAGMDADTAALFPDELVESELGLIPKGWTVGEVGDCLSKLETGKRPKGGVKGITKGVPSVGAESIDGIGVYDYSKTKYVPTEFFESMNKGHGVGLDVLLYKDGGKPGEFKPRIGMYGFGFPFERYAINEHIFAVRAHAWVGQSFLYFWLSTPSAFDMLATAGGKAAIPGINQAAVKTLPLLLASEGIHAAYSRITDPMIERILELANESNQLAKMRDSLLPRLISGKLQLPASAADDQAIADEDGLSV